MTIICFCLAVSIALIFICGIIIHKRKDAEVDLKASQESNVINENFNYDYDEGTGIYTIYDENGNVRGIVDNEFDLEVYRYDKDFNQEDAPPGM